MLNSLAVSSPFATYSRGIPSPNPPAPAYGIEPYRSYAPPVQYHQPPQAKPSVWETYRGALTPYAPPVSPFQSLTTGIRHNGEGAVIGALLGAAQRYFGTLDIAGKYPADGILALVLLALSVNESGKPNGFSSDLLAMSQSCTTILSYRKFSGDKSEKGGDKTIPGNTQASATHSDDPIVQAAREAKLL